MKKALLLIAATSSIMLAGCNLKNITKEIIETSFDQSGAQQTGIIEETTKNENSGETNT
jgi:protein involved in sex pheromone biosynthesis